MARPVLWPAALPPDAAALPPGPLAALDADGFAAAFGPDFSRLAGFRVGATAVAAAPVTRPVTAARLKLGPSSSRIDLLVEAGGAAVLLERLFGARAAEAIAELPVLPPSSASWLCLCRLLAAAAGRALAACGLPPGGSPELPPRAMATAGGSGPAFLLQAEEARIHLLLDDPQGPAAPPPPLADPALWRRRARARALDIELPVTLRLADRRMGVGDIAALQPGDVLPLDAPHAVDVLVGGRRLGKARLDEGGPA